MRTERVPSKRQDHFTLTNLHTYANIRKYINESYINMGESLEWINLAPHDNKSIVFQKKVEIS
jgi:hypothetical protein